jgi:hypothetical protein
MSNIGEGNKMKMNGYWSTWSRNQFKSCFKAEEDQSIHPPRVRISNKENRNKDLARQGKLKANKQLKE